MKKTKTLLTYPIYLIAFFALVAPLSIFSQTVSGPGGPLTPAGTTSGVVTYPASNPVVVAGSTIPGGTCPVTGTVIPDLAVPAILGYNTEITNITLFTVQHTFAADLDLRLIAPDGTILTFNLDNGGSTGLDVASDMCFDITAANCADLWTSSGSAVQPANCMLFETTENICGPLTAPFDFVCGLDMGSLNGVAVDGTWTLEITDDAGGDTGAFGSFSITFGPMAPPAVDQNGNAVDLLSCCAPAAVCDLNLTGVNSTDETCLNASDGTITLTATTSFGPITYSISGPVNQSNQTGVFTGLPPGAYLLYSK